MSQKARLETILGRLNSGLPIVGETFADKSEGSQHYGEHYTVSCLKVSPNGRICLQVTYEDGARCPIILDNSSDDIYIPKISKPIKIPVQGSTARFESQGTLNLSPETVRRCRARQKETKEQRDKRARMADEQLERSRAYERGEWDY